MSEHLKHSNTVNRRLRVTLRHFQQSEGRHCVCCCSEHHDSDSNDEIPFNRGSCFFSEHQPPFISLAPCSSSTVVSSSSPSTSSTSTSSTSSFPVFYSPSYNNNTKDRSDDFIESNKSVEKRMALISMNSTSYVREQDLYFDIDEMKKIFNDSTHDHIRSSLFNLPLSHSKLFKITDEEYWNPNLQRKLAFERMKVMNNLGLINVTDQMYDAKKVCAFLENASLLDPCAAAKLGIHYLLFGGSILFLGNYPTKDIMFEKINHLEMFGSFAMTELCHGSNVQGIETIASYIPETKEFEIKTKSDSAQKFLIGNGALHSNWCVVFAQLLISRKNHGVHAFLCRIRDDQQKVVKGVRILDVGHKIGMNGLDNARIMFDGLRIPKSQLLGRFGNIDDKGNYKSNMKSEGSRFFAHISALMLGRVTTVVTSVSGMKLALFIALRYALSRRQFKPISASTHDTGDEEIPIIQYLSHQRSLISLLASMTAATFTADTLKERVSMLLSGGEPEEDDKGFDNQELHAQAAAMKAYFSNLFMNCVQQCRELCGGMGYISINRLGMLKEAADAACSYEGANYVMSQLAARYLLDGLKKQFSKKGTMISSMQYMLKKLKLSLGEMNPVSVRTKSNAHLESEVFQLKAFEFREWNLIYLLAKRLQNKITTQNLTEEEAWNQSLDYVLHLNTAYTERIMLQQFIAKIHHSPKVTDSTRPILNKLRSLFALHRMSRDNFFLEYKYVAGNKSKAINDIINELCAQVLPHVRSILEAFDFPDHVVQSPIASNWIEHFKFEQ